MKKEWLVCKIGMGNELIFEAAFDSQKEAIDWVSCHTSGSYRIIETLKINLG